MSAKIHKGVDIFDDCFVPDMNPWKFVQLLMKTWNSYLMSSIHHSKATIVFGMLIERARISFFYSHRVFVFSVWVWHLCDNVSCSLGYGCSKIDLRIKQTLRQFLLVSVNMAEIVVKLKSMLGEGGLAIGQVNETYFANYL